MSRIGICVQAVLPREIFMVSPCARAQARAMCESWPYQISSECVAELIASDSGDPDYLVSCVPPPCMRLWLVRICMSEMHVQ